MAKLTVPIVIDWDNIKDSLEQHDVVEVVRCEKCIMKRICRYKAGLGDNGFCSQGISEEKDEMSSDEFKITKFEIDRLLKQLHPCVMIARHGIEEMKREWQEKYSR